MFLVATVIHFDIASLFIFAITIFYVVYRKLYRAYSSLVFLGINILYALICVFDIFVSSDMLNNAPIAMETFMFLYYLLKYMASILYVIYIILVTNSRDIIKKRRNGILFSLPFVITLGFLIANFFTGYIYYFDANNVYHRGNLIFVFYGLSFIYVVIGIIWLLFNRKMFDFSELFSLFSVYALSIMALIVQYFIDYVLIEILSTSLGFLLLSVTVERSQLIVDPRTGLKNKTNFERTTYTIFRRNVEGGVVIFYVKNYSVIYEKYSYEIALKNIRTMVNYLSRAFQSEIKYDSYYIDGGIFALITKDDDEAAILASKINEAIITVYNKQLAFNVDYVLCSAKLPYDFKNFDDFNEFIFSFSDSIEFNKKLMNMKDVKSDEKHNILMRLDDILDKVIENKEIMVEYQPIYQLSDKKYRAVEALARIYDSELGVIKAESFIEYAEKNNRIFEIDMIIIEKVFQFYNAYQLSDYGLTFIGINLSTQTICDREFLYQLMRLEKKYGVDRNMIFFEVKERESTTFNQHVFDTIVQMMAHGFQFSLDNYGTGSMPVDNLVKVPYKNIKIDNTFAKSYNNQNTRIIIDNTIRLFKRLNRMSICVGVEDEEAAKEIEALNPDGVQGYYYSKPLALDELIEFLKKENNIA